MSFQQSVGFTTAFGRVGEFAYSGPRRVQPAILNSADPTMNVIGRAAVILAGATGSFPVAGDAGANPKTLSVGMGVAGVFAGILMFPKDYVSYGTSAGGPLAPTVTLPNGTVVELATEGDVTVALPAASNPGDVVYVKTADGTLVTAAPGAAIPAASFGPIGTVERFVNGAAGLAVVHIEPRVPSLIP